MRLMLRSAAVVSLLLCAGAARAALVWESSAIELTAEQGQKSTTAVFKFTNRGEKAVKITSVSTSCGCTIAKPAKDVVAPGEAGELPAVLAIGESAMTRHVSIRVETDDGAPRTYELSLTAQVAELVTVSQRLVLWRVGSAADERRLEVKTLPGIALGDVSVQGEGFTTRVENGPHGETVIWVAPTSTEGRQLATLKIAAKRASGEEVAAKVFLRVAAP